MDPKPEELNGSQRQWNKGYEDAFEAALTGPDIGDPNVGYEAFVDVDSFVDHHMLVAIAIVSVWDGGMAEQIPVVALAG